MFNDITICPDCQELSDISGAGKNRPWKQKKMQALRLADLYAEFDESKSERMKRCGDFLTFAREGEKLKLKQGMFCKIRLCPMCQWRRSRKIHTQMTNIMNVLQTQGEYVPIAVNPTVRNCQAEELPAEITRLLRGWRKIWRDPLVEEKTVGWYRALEITYNRATKTYHPHLHCILIGQKHYYKRGQIPVEHIAGLWKKGCGIDYNANLKMYALRKKHDQDWAEAMLEFAKYTTPETWDIMPRDQADKQELVGVAKTLDNALRGRRLIGLGGELANLHHLLNLSDMEDGEEDWKPGDDIHTDEDFIRYVWRAGAYVVYNDEKSTT